VKWAQWDKNPIQRTVSLFICVCIALCTIVAHNIAQNRPDKSVRRQTYSYLPSRRTSMPTTGTKLYCLVTEAHVCEQLAQGHYWQRLGRELNSRPLEVASQRLNHYTTRSHLHHVLWQVKQRKFIPSMVFCHLLQNLEQWQLIIYCQALFQWDLLNITIKYILTNFNTLHLRVMQQRYNKPDKYIT